MFPVSLTHAELHMLMFATMFAEATIREDVQLAKTALMALRLQRNLSPDFLPLQGKLCLVHDDARSSEGCCGQHTWGN